MGLWFPCGLKRRVALPLHQKLVLPPGGAVAEEFLNLKFLLLLSLEDGVPHRRRGPVEGLEEANMKYIMQPPQGRRELQPIGHRSYLLRDWDGTQPLHRKFMGPCRGNR